MQPLNDLTRNLKRDVKQLEKRVKQLERDLKKEDERTQRILNEDR